MPSQCPHCYSAEIVVVRPRSLFIWLAPILLVDAVILAVAFSGLVENPIPLIVALVVADMLLTLPLMRAILSRNQTQGGVTYRCMECGHTWTEERDASAVPDYGIDRPARAEQDGAAPAVASADFQMTVEDVFSIKGRGTIVTGRVEAGSVAQGATIAIHGAAGVREVVVDAVEMFRKILPQADVGNNVGLLLRGVGKGEVQRGDVLRGSR